MLLSQCQNLEMTSARSDLALHKKASKYMSYSYIYVVSDNILFNTTIEHNEQQMKIVLN